jgi:hypothetical protein
VAFTVSVVSPRASDAPLSGSRKRAFLTETDMRRSRGQSLAAAHLFARRFGGEVSTAVDLAGTRTLTLYLPVAPNGRAASMALKELS